MENPFGNISINNETTETETETDAVIQQAIQNVNDDVQQATAEELQEDTEPQNTDDQQVEQPLPLSVSSFQPIDGNGNIITQISPAKFDILLKILNVIISNNKNTSGITIKKSKINQSIGSAIISTNLADVFEGQEIDLHITDPKKTIKLFKQFRNDNNIFILDDASNSRFIVTNGEVKLFMPKQLESLTNETSLPDFTGGKAICNFEIDKSTKDIIKGLMLDIESVEYLLQNDTVKAIHIPDTAIYLFPQFINDPDAAKLNEVTADLALRTSAFLPINSTKYEILIGQMSDGTYISWVEALSPGFPNIVIFEKLEDVTGGNLLL